MPVLWTTRGEIDSGIITSWACFPDTVRGCCGLLTFPGAAIVATGQPVDEVEGELQEMGRLPGRRGVRTRGRRRASTRRAEKIEFVSRPAAIARMPTTSRPTLDPARAAIATC